MVLFPYMQHDRMEAQPSAELNPREVDEARLDCELDDYFDQMQRALQGLDPDGYLGRARRTI